MASPRANGSSYDVFLSFRGEDTRHSFTDHLYSALKHGGILAFRDTDDAARGEELKNEIEVAIKASDASIIVLSKNYATSTWCLDELCLILERRRDCNHFVLPVFYHVDPSDVRNQTGTFMIEDRLNSSSRWTDDNIKRWKEALTEVSGVIGMSVVGPETEFLVEVVGTIYTRLDLKEIYIPPNLTGMDSRSKEIKSWINQPGAEFLVIHGMPGGGKSTLAKYIVYSTQQYFESISIVEGIGSKCKEPRGMLQVQEQLCKDMLKGKDKRIPSVCQGTPTIEVLLGKRKALIVLDDIVEESQLERLLGSGNVNKESKIIITTNNDLSNWFKKKGKRCQEYEMKLLNGDESIELLCLHAFRSKNPMDGFKELAERVVQYCEGNPLALEVFGSSLSKDTSIRFWESELNMLGKDLHGDIGDVLKRSYDLLPLDAYKELFLHIACFFVGKDMDYVVKILEDDYSAFSGIKALSSRCLLYVTSKKKLMMHRLFQEMGRRLVDQESHVLAERRRLWRNKDSFYMLKRQKGSDVMEGLALDMHKLVEEDEVNYKELKQLSTKSLQQMDRLKFLKLNFVKLTGSYEDFSEHLRWLCWFGFNNDTIHSDIFMGNLVALDMSYSCLTEFEPPTVLKSLKILNFKDSWHLRDIRNIYQIPNLETLILWNCCELVHVCDTLGNLKWLDLLNMTGCENLCKRDKNSRVSTVGGESELELSFPLPHSLQRLFLKNCKLECTNYVPLSFSEQLSLQYLDLGNSVFEELPSYIHLKNLRVLDLSLCSKLKWLLCLPSTLAELYIYNCKSLEKITFESGRYRLQEIGYTGCANLSEIEGLLKLVLIAKLDETDLGHMMWLKEYENHEICLAGDDELTKERSCRLQMLFEFDIMSTSLPDIKHPKLTPGYTSQSTFLSFEVPSCDRNRRLKGLDVTFRYKISGDDWVWFCKISTTNGDDLIYNPKVFGKPELSEVGTWLSYWTIGNRLNVGDEVNISIVVTSGLEVLECGAHLVYADDDVAGEILENEIGWVETLGGEFSGFQLKTGAYYLCRRDYFALMEVGRLPSDWFSVLVGDRLESTEVRGWRMTGRPQQSYQSFMELKTIGCIIDNDELVQNENYLSMEWVAMQWFPAGASIVTHQVMMYQKPPPHYFQYYQQQQNQQYQQHLQQKGNRIQSTSEDIKTIWVGDLQYWMDEGYLQSCFAQTGEVSSIKLIRNKQTGQSERYGFIEFLSHGAAEKVLQSYNGTMMPYTDQVFRLNWASFSMGEKRAETGSDLSIFIGDLAPDVTDTILYETFAGRYPSVKATKVVVDTNTGCSKGYGFVRFGDENERARAVNEMNGVYCSSRPMRIGVTTPKKAPQNSQSDGDSSNTTIFVGGLDSEVTDEDLRQTFSQCGEILSVKIPIGKGCAFVQFSSRSSAEDAIQNMHGTVIGKQTVRISWGRSPVNKQGIGTSGNYYMKQSYDGGYGYHGQQNQDSAETSAGSEIRQSS